MSNWIQLDTETGEITGYINRGFEEYEADEQDQDAYDLSPVEDPRDYSPVQYQIFSSRYAHWENARDRACDAAVTLPLYLYNHSVTRVSTESFIGRAHHAEWDSGQVGIVYLTKDQIREQWQVQRVTRRVRDEAKAFIREHVKDFDAYLNS